MDINTEETIDTALKTQDTESEELIPVVALRGLTIIPGMSIHFDLNRSRSVMAVEAAMAENSKIFTILQRDMNTEEPGQDDLYTMGCICDIKQLLKLPGGIIRVLAEGLERARLIRLDSEKPFLRAVSGLITQEEERDGLSYEEEIAMVRELAELFGEYVKIYPKVGKSLEGYINELTGLEKLIDRLMINLPFQYSAKQQVMEAVSLKERYEKTAGLLESEVAIAKIREKLSMDTKARVEKSQKEYILREQMRSIEEELGDADDKAEVGQMQDKCDALQASDEIKAKITKEIGRLKKMSGVNSEAAVERAYIETLLEMPWDKRSDDRIDLALAEEILERDHYGLKEVKERILEFIAVKALNSKGESPIICLVGPPGTGKTSIAKSVAEALNRKYIRVCLGGVRDEAEIRGHRKTYIGAMPGRIVTAIKDAGVKNPLMLLDEVDKMSSDHRGDTASALLEVLDSEQNVHFRDHYLELPIDLSEVMFICTANSLSDISKPLLDRMEIIEINSYTANEKFHIAKEHLYPKCLDRHGLTKQDLSISGTALKNIIDFYTREAGVRGLERRINELCRKSAKAILEDREKGKEHGQIRVSASNLSDFLGKKKYRRESAPKENDIGIVRGLAWTSVGGDTLEIEVNVYPGRGEIILTGQMGDVMKESARIGLGYIRSIAEEYGIDSKVFQKKDIHIHIPEGAVPKDGPSAGITMATAMLSALAQIPVKGLLAMTGEITLRGRVLPIGGLKEKLLAASQAGITQVIVPCDNEKDVDEIDEEIIGGMKIRYAKTMKDVLKWALVRGDRENDN